MLFYIAIEKKQMLKKITHSSIINSLSSSIDMGHFFSYNIYNFYKRIIYVKRKVKSKIK